MGGSPIDQTRRSLPPVAPTNDSNLRGSALLPGGAVAARHAVVGALAAQDAVEMPQQASRARRASHERGAGVAPPAPTGALAAAAMQRIQALGEINERMRETGVDPRTTALVAKLCLAEFSSDAAQGECIQRIQTALDAALAVERGEKQDVAAFAQGNQTIGRPDGTLPERPGGGRLPGGVIGRPDFPQRPGGSASAGGAIGCGGDTDIASRGGGALRLSKGFGTDGSGLSSERLSGVANRGGMPVGGSAPKDDRVSADHEHLEATDDTNAR